ncbi:MAG TPA: PDZ domain-containing protein [Gammaproteobacteria bacterium]|nr:PDZ domain-containing protein [Gammaproteobacteria bacterium]
MRSSIISLGLAGIIGVVIGLLLQPPPPAPPARAIGNPSNSIVDTVRATAGPEASATSLGALRQQLQQEIAARIALQEKVQLLDQQLATLSDGKGSDSKAEPVRQNSSHTDSPSSPSRQNRARRAWFDAQALIDAGVDATTAQELKARFEKQELDRLYLRDQAVREGWFGSRRYREEVKKLDAKLGNLQEELGGDTYAAYLYATGQSNRVAVQSVLAGSAADQAGLQSDDQILSYGEKRIYNWRDLRTATTEGDISETVPLTIVRNGKPMTLYVQRGPLGIRMSSVSIAP